MHRDTGFILAIKAISLSRSEQDVIKKEVDILKKCRHVNIVQYYGSCYNDENLWARPSLFFILFLFFFIFIHIFLCGSVRLTRADSDGLLRSGLGDRPRPRDQAHAERGRDQRRHGSCTQGIAEYLP